MTTRQVNPLSKVLDAVLGCSIIFFLFKLLPFHNWSGVLTTLDVRNWTSRTWFIANALLFASMFVIRFGPTLGAATQKILARYKPLRRVPDDANQPKQLLTDAEERALYKRMSEARKKQVI
jgi:hypothetical protein